MESGQSESKQISSEFDAPRWSVMSFDDCAASGLAYEEARKMVEQMSDNVAGLCIVTDEAAQRMLNSKNQKSSSNSQSPEVAAPKTFADIL